MEKEPDRSCSVISSVRLRGFHKKIHRETKSSRSPYSPIHLFNRLCRLRFLRFSQLFLFSASFPHRFSLPFFQSLLPIHSPISLRPPLSQHRPHSSFHAQGLTSLRPAPFRLPQPSLLPSTTPPSTPTSPPPRCCRLPLNRRSASHLSSRWAPTRTRIPRPTRLPPLPVILSPIRKTPGDAASPDQPAMFPPPMRFSRNPGHSPIMGLRWIGSTWRVCRLPRR